jgi:hypothetical protein
MLSQNILQAQAPLLTNITQAVRMLHEINKSMINKQELAEQHRLLFNRLRLQIAVGSKRKPEGHGTHFNNIILRSFTRMHSTRYRLPIGDIIISYEAGSGSDRSLSGDYEYTGWLKWEFHAAPWLSHTAITTKALLHIRSPDCGLYVTPTITRNLTVSIDLSDSHPVWGCIDNGDILGIQKMLCSGYVRVNDTHGGSGRTLLHYTCDFQGRYWEQKSNNWATSQYIEIMKTLISAGADCNSLDFYRR